MRKSFYPKLAWDGIKKNKRLYIPYLITCIVMIMMYYIISFLASSHILSRMSGGSTIAATLNLGKYVIAIFSFIFLLYTNSFLIRRRKKEFGLYNILGMDKKNIAKLLAWESIFSAGISMISGTVFGVSLSKLSELALINVMKGKIDYSFYISWSALGEAILFFAAIFAVILLNDLRQIHFTNPVQLLQGESAGEKAPKANWAVGILGILLLASAYYLAITITDPVDALVWFFFAVVLVIAGTYLTFISGSVIFCKLLQKNKRYYYKPNHFVSVSSMVYRMKRNGAGLASICILATMVLVMISTTACLYFGTEESLNSEYKDDIKTEVFFGSYEYLYNDSIEKVRANISEVIKSTKANLGNVKDYRLMCLAASCKDNTVLFDDKSIEAAESSTYSLVYFIPLEDYNKATGNHNSLNDNEILLITSSGTLPFGSTLMLNNESYTVKGEAEALVKLDRINLNTNNTVFIVTNDFFRVAEKLIENRDGGKKNQYIWTYSFDCDLSAEEQITLSNRLYLKIHDMYKAEDYVITGSSSYGRAAARESFYGMYGGLFFIGILLSVVFIFAAVLIIYYKQISEGYEDRARFNIMQKTGMTKKLIKKSINSQLLTVFFLPLIFAAVHLCFSFPFIKKILFLFRLANVPLFAFTMLICFAVFALFYTLVYKKTSNTYYSIVSGTKEG